MTLCVDHTVSTAFLRIQERIACACQKAGRAAETVRLVSVCKKQPPERILEAVGAGAMDLGENTLQGLQATQAVLDRMQHHSQGDFVPQNPLSSSNAPESLRWHFVGQLQRRKVRQLLAYDPVVHSVDRVALAEEISRRFLARRNQSLTVAASHNTSPSGESPDSVQGAEEAVGHGGTPGRDRVDILIQVNTGNEAQKGGVAPERLIDFAAQVAELEGVRVRGLMAIPPATEPGARHFEMLARLQQSLQGCPDASWLSMGMSHDFEEAIACGATMVRVGTAIFGQRLAR